MLLKDKEENSEFENIVSAFLVTKKNPLLTKIKDNKEKIADMSRQRPSSLSVKRSEGGGGGADHFSLVTGMGANKKVKLRRLMTLKKGSAGERERERMLRNDAGIIFGHTIFAKNANTCFFSDLLPLPFKPSLNLNVRHCSRSKC